MEHLTTSQLGAALDHVRAAPASVGTLEMIACRPAVDQRRVLDSAILDLEAGLVGDQLYLDLDLSVADLPAGSRALLATCSGARPAGS
ncbi:MAG: hypothetical protein U5K29_11970 [Acidimicrobiales bacterium]|nr:hypothetical protein [Acidimicrobiales bacterium]